MDGINQLVDAFHLSTQIEFQRDLVRALGKLCRSEVVRANFGEGPSHIRKLVQVCAMLEDQWSR